MDQMSLTKRGPRAVFALATGSACALLLSAGPAQASPPSAVTDITSSSVNATQPSVGVAANGTQTVTWVQNLGSIAEPSGYAIRALRISFKTVTVTTGSGKNRKTVRKVVQVKAPVSVLSESGKSVRDAVASTSSGGTTTVVWSTLDENGTTVSVRGIRIDPAGAVGAPFELAATGSRVRYIRVASSGNGTTTVVWRRDDSRKSWIEARRIAPAGDLGETLDLTPDHGSYFDPRLAVRPDGSADVVWRRESGIGAAIQAIQIKATGALGEIIDLSNLDRQAAEEPVITMAPNGRANIAWAEWTGSNYMLRFVRLDAAGARGRYVDVATQATSPNPAVGVDSAGTTSIAWSYKSRAGQFKARLKRFTATYRAGSLLELGPARDALVEGYGPTITVAPSGMTTVVYSAVQAGLFPPQVYFQGLRVDVKGNQGKPSTIVAPGRAGSLPELVHSPIAAIAPDGTAVIVFTRQKASTGSPALLKLVSWK